MKTTLLLILIGLCCVTVWGQKQNNKTVIDANQVTLKKQIIADQLENESKDMPLAAVRVFMKYKTAAWLWRNGKDETGRAEQITVEALDELYQRKTEIPSLYFSSLSSDIFVLLEKNAKEKAKKMGIKYNLSFEDELDNANSLLKKPGGEKLAADKIKKSLVNQTELSSTTTLLMEELRSRKSPELLGILAEILNLEEGGKSGFSAEPLFFTVDFFRDETVSNELRMRFYRVIFNKARNTFQFPDSDVLPAYDLLSAVMQDISANAPNLLSEASALQSALATRVSYSIREEREIYERIDGSADRLDAMISEAEATENKSLKENLLTQAARLALKRGKFRLAVDLAEKIKVDKDGNKIFIRWYDQFLGEVSQSALKKDDIDSAKYAAKKIIDKLSLAEILRQTALYYFEKQDLISATDALNEALKLTANADNDTRRIYTFIHLISTTQKIDKDLISDVTEKTAKAINALPTLSIDDKPETENYKNYVASIMSINLNLLPVFSELIKKNKVEATDFASRINRKEIKAIVNYVLLIDSFNAETETNRKERL